MVNTILGRKLGMTQVWGEDDTIVPVTVIQAGPCVISQVKTTETDGYEAVQIGFGAVSDKKLTKALKGHFAKADVAAKKVLRDFRLEDLSALPVGEIIKADTFTAGDKVDVCGTSKGKGYAGVMKRYGFRGGPGGHGAHFHRAPGSVGQCATPSRVFKGLRLPGHMGCDTVTVKNLELVGVDEDQNLIMVKGAVPGGVNGIVRVRIAQTN